MRVTVAEHALCVERVDGQKVPPEEHRAALAEALGAAVLTRDSRARTPIEERADEIEANLLEIARLKSSLDRADKLLCDVAVARDAAEDKHRELLDLDHRQRRAGR